MRNLSRRIVQAGLALGLALLSVAGSETVQAQELVKTGDTRVARWKDDKTAVFLLMFDDGWPSAWQVAIPELASRGMTATFYICPEKGEYKKFADTWTKLANENHMVLANHTMTHQGVKNLEDARYQIMGCSKVIREIQPGKEGRLVSYGQPGVAKEAWNITGPELEQILTEDHLISRPPFTDHGAVYHLKTLEDMVGLADKAIAAKGMEYLVVHGVERITPNWGFQDMWPLKQDIFLPLLDALKERRDRGDLWITDHISQHQYEKERDGATVKVLESSDALMKLDLTSTSDAKLYDYPLTLVTKVPAAWKGADVTRNGKTVRVTADKETIRWEAVPNAGPIEIRPADAALSAEAR